MISGTTQAGESFSTARTISEMSCGRIMSSAATWPLTKSVMSVSTKAGVIGYTQAMNKELNAAGIKSVALCPGFVETPMTEFVREHVPAEDMIRVEDIAEAVRFVVATSPSCVIPEIVFQRPGESV